MISTIYNKKTVLFLICIIALFSSLNMKKSCGKACKDKKAKKDEDDNYEQISKYLDESGTPTREQVLRDLERQIQQRRDNEITVEQREAAENYKGERNDDFKIIVPKCPFSTPEECWKHLDSFVSKYGEENVEIPYVNTKFDQKDAPEMKKFDLINNLRVRDNHSGELIKGQAFKFK
jgi:hypothetical protein